MESFFLNNNNNNNDNIITKIILMIIKIIIIIIIEKERKSQNTREAMRIKQRKKSVSRLGIDPRTIVYAPLRSDH